VWGAALGAWDGKLYLVGGTRIVDFPWTPVARVDIFDIASLEWTAGGGQAMPTAASVFGSAQAGQYLYAVGGYSGDLNNNVDQAQRYDMRTDTWEAGPQFASARALGGLAVTSSNLYFLGGDETGGGGYDATDLVEVLDLSTWPGGAWASLGDPLPAVNLHPATTASSAMIGGEIWVVGGLVAGVSIYDEVYYRAAEPGVPFYSADLPREAWNLGNHPGEWAYYTLPVINNGTLSDTYTVTVDSDWSAIYPGSIGPLEPGEIRLLQVQVNIPSSPASADFDTGVLTITSQGDLNAWDTAVLTTSVTDWQEAANVPIRVGFQSKAQCVDDPDGFYILGGTTPSGTIDDIYHYDASTDTWTFITDLPVGGYGKVVTCYKDKLYVAGGVFTDRFDVFDLILGTWSPLHTPPRQFFAAAMGAWDGRLYVAGGSSWEGIGFTPTDQVYVYDIASNMWFGGPSMPVASMAYGTVQAGPYLYVVGGVSGDWNDNLDITLRLNMATEAWETGPAFPSQRAMVALGITAHHLYALGGDINGGDRLDPTGLVEVLDLSQWPEGEWSDIDQPMPWTLEGYDSFCTEAVTGGEIWSIGGAYGRWPTYDVIDNAYYLPAGEPCVSYGVELPEPWQGEGVPGETIEYVLTITNTGVITDYYLLSAPTTWPATSVLGGPGGPVAPGESIQVIVAVDVPADAMAGEQGVTEVTATSMSNPDAQAVTTITTTVLEEYGVDLSPASLEDSGLSGETVAYALTLTNLGNITDTFTLSYTGNLWEVALSVMTATLEAFDSLTVNVDVTIPEGALPGEQDGVTISAVSQAEPEEQDSALITTTAEAVYDLSLLPASQEDSGLPGATVAYTLTLTNLGNITDTFTLSYTGSLWEGGLPVTTTSLGAGEAIEVSVLVTIPLEALADEQDGVTINAVSQTEPAEQGSALITTTAEAVYGLSLEPASQAGSAAPGTAVEYVLTLTNLGNITDTFTLSYTGGLWEVALPVTTTLLGAGESLQVSVFVTIPLEAADGAIDVLTLTATSQGDMETSAQALLTSSAAWYKTYLPLVFNN
jgi:uncharacterized membrane protein